MLSRRSFAALSAGAGLASATQRARAASSTIKIGVITDMTGPLSSVLGMGSVEGARMAVEDFGGRAASMPVEVIFADHQSKADIALSIARKWIDEDGVDLLLDIGNSAAAIAVQTLVRDKNKIGIITGAASSDITGKFCNRNSFHWGYDTYMQSAALAGACGSIHAFELRLESLVEQTVALQSKKRVQLPIPLEPLEDELLLAAGRFPGIPALDRHGASDRDTRGGSRRSRPELAVDPRGGRPAK